MRINLAWALPFLVTPALAAIVFMSCWIAGVPVGSDARASIAILGSVLSVIAVVVVAANHFSDSGGIWVKIGKDQE